MDSPTVGVTSAGAMRPFVGILLPLVVLVELSFHVHGCASSNLKH